MKILSGVHVPDSGRVEVARRRGPAAQPQGRPGARHRHRLPGGPRRAGRARSSTTSGWAPTTRGGRRIPGREKRRLAQGAPWRSCSAGRSTSARSSTSCRSVDRQACCIVRALLRTPAHPDPRRGDVGARRRHPRPAVRAGRPRSPRGRRRRSSSPTGWTRSSRSATGSRSCAPARRSPASTADRGRRRTLVRLMTGADELVTTGRPETGAGRRPQRRAGAERARPAAAARRPADRPGDHARASSSGSPGSRATARTSSLRRCGARTSSRARSSGTCPAAMWSSAPPCTPPTATSPTSRASGAWTPSSAG